MDDEAGVVAGRYQVMRLLGRGGMGEVVLARQLNLDRLVVLKRVLDDHSGRHVEALLDEARVAARLHHPNIVSVLDVSRVNEPPFVAMELVLGVTLREMIDANLGGLPVEIALTIGMDLLRGLAYAHGVRSGANVGIVHRDVKPRNVMVTFTGVTKLIDFGISRWLSEGGSWDATSISGTPGYMAPEQHRGLRADGRADQYAAGVTLREMLTGAPPIADENAARPQVAIDPELAAIIDRSTALAQHDRHADCAAMLAAIEAFATTRGITQSPTRVERWMSSQFAARREAVERDVATVVAPRARLPTSPTVIDRSTPKRHPRISFIVRNAGGEADAWLAPVIERLVRKQFRHTVDRRFFVATASDSERARRVELVYTRDETAIRIDAVELGSATATSVVGAITELVSVMTRDLGHDLEPLGADDREAAAMRRLGAGSFDSFREYRAIIEVLTSGSWVDTQGLAARVDRLLPTDPDWSHLYALLALLRGGSTPDAIRALEAGRSREPSRDPTGMRLIEALLLRVRGEQERAADGLSELFRTDMTDVLVGYELLIQNGDVHRHDESAALARRLHEQFPELGFGTDAAAALRRQGRDRDAEAVTRAWIAAVPDNPAAAVDFVRLEASAGRIGEAQRCARDMMLVHGDSDETLVQVYEALVLSEQIAAAHAIADRMVMSTPLVRAQGRYRIAVAAVFEGRFAAAYDALRKAVVEYRPFGFQSELSQCFELLRAIAPLVADVAAQRRWTAELVDVFAVLIGDVAAATATRYELALLDREHPAIADALSDLPDGVIRDVARRRILRAAAIAGVGSFADAVAAGFSADEENAGSLLALGICARHEQELDLARRSLEKSAALWSSAITNQASPYAAVLARFHLGGVFEELGDRAAARDHYEAFLRCWGHADRPIPEVAVALRALTSQA